MNATRSSVLVAEVVAGYAELQREMHDALIAQHPEWVLPNGDCPTCDSYKLRSAELLRQTQEQRRLAKPQQDKRETLFGPAGYLCSSGIPRQETSSYTNAGCETDRWA